MQQPKTSTPSSSADASPTYNGAQPQSGQSTGVRGDGRAPVTLAGAISPNSVLSLQRLAGNRATTSLLRQPQRTIQREVTDQEVSDYRTDIANSSAWGTVDQAQALAANLRISFHVFRPARDGGIEIAGHAGDAPDAAQQHLFFVGGNHYEVLVKVTKKEARRLQAEQRAVYQNKADSTWYKPHALKARTDGSCMYDAIHILFEGRKANDEEIRNYRAIAAAETPEEAIRAEIQDLKGDQRVGRRLFGLGPKMRQALKIRDESELSLSEITEIIKALENETEQSGDRPLYASQLQSLEGHKQSATEALFHDCERLADRAEARLNSPEIIKLFYEMTGYFRYTLGAQIGELRTGLQKSRGKHEELKEIYRQLQGLNIFLMRYDKEKQIVEVGVGKDEEDEQAMEVLRGDIDYRVMRLTALLSDGKTSKGQNRFKATMEFLGGDNPTQLKDRYQMAQGRDLDADLKSTYGEHTLRYKYLKQILDTGYPSAQAQLALKLGLLYKGATPFDTKDKTRVAALLSENPLAFQGLLDTEANDQVLAEHFTRALLGEESNLTALGVEQQFILAAYHTLRNSGVMGELRALVAIKQAEKSPKAISEAEKSQHQANYLMAIIINQEKVLSGERGLPERRNIGKASFGIHTKGLTQRLLQWARTMASPDERQAFAAAGRRFYPDTEASKQGSGKQAVDKAKIAPYQEFWQQVQLSEMVVAAKARYVLKIVEGMAGTSQSDPTGKLDELEATLELHADDKYWISKRIARTSMKHLVMQFLSVTDERNFNPQQALIERYHPDPAKVQQKIAVDRKALQTAVETAFARFEPYLVEAKLVKRQREQIKEFILLGGVEGANDQFNQVSIYQKLKAKQRKQQHGSSKRILELIQQLDPSTLEFQLVKQDNELIGYIWQQTDLFSENREWKIIKAILDHGPGPLMEGAPRPRPSTLRRMWSNTSSASTPTMPSSIPRSFGPASWPPSIS